MPGSGQNLSPLKLLGCSQISVASFMMQSLYPITFPSKEMLLKSILCATSVLCSATTDFCGWLRHVCLLCSLHLVSVVLLVCPTCTSLHSQEIQNIPRTYQTQFSLAGLICAFFFSVLD
jgi:hypothetical protein